MPQKTEKIRSQHSSLTGWQVSTSLKALGVPLNRFARQTGMSESRVRRMSKGELDGDIPLWVELVLMLYHVMPELREREGRIALPLDEWGARGSAPKDSD